MLIAQYKFARNDSRICVHSLLQGETIASEETASEVLPSIPELPDIEDIASSSTRCLSAPGAEDDISNDDTNDLIVDYNSDDDLMSSGQNLTSCNQVAPCTVEQRYRCKRMLHNYRRRTETLTDDRTDDDEIENLTDLDSLELAKHSIFLALLCVSAVVVIKF